MAPSVGDPTEKKKHNPHTKSIKAKNLMCERQVDRPAHEPHDNLVLAIKGHELHFWFLTMEG
ncbi:unnamed protein product, partial [Ilex paraguariensis]